MCISDHFGFQASAQAVEEGVWAGLFWTLRDFYGISAEGSGRGVEGGGRG